MLDKLNSKAFINMLGGPEKLFSLLESNLPQFEQGLLKALKSQPKKEGFDHPIAVFQPANVEGEDRLIVYFTANRDAGEGIVEFEKPKDGMTFSQFVKRSITGAKNQGNGE